VNAVKVTVLLGAVALPVTGLVPPHEGAEAAPMVVALPSRPATAGDTVVTMRRGDRVVLANLQGEVVIEGWDADRREVEGLDGEAELDVERSGGEVRVVRGGRRHRRDVEASIRVPSWADVEIVGISLDVHVRGLAGELRVGNVSGDIRIRDVTGPVDARSIDGSIEIEGARGGVRASSQSDDVLVVGAAGPIEAHSGSGDLLLSEIESASVRAETQDGDVRFSGTIADGGSYGFFVHDGDAEIEIPEGVNAQVSVSTFDGEFESQFPVVVQRFTGGREFEFVLGEGGARIEIEVFDGEIRLLRR